MNDMQLPGASPSNRSMPVAEWPALDRDAWSRALQAGDPLDPGGLAAGWAPTTRRETAAGYGRWLTWLGERGLLDPRLQPGARVTRDRVRAYATDLQALVSPHTVVARLLQLWHAMRALDPAGDWQWLMRAACRLRDRARSVRNKRARLQSPERLAVLGEDLMKDAASRGSVTRSSARQFRNGLIIAFLAHRPIRACNLTAITLGKQLTKRGSSWWLVFAASETKTGQPLEFPLPESLAPYLECYLDRYRPFLLTRGGERPPAPTSALWISRLGRPMAFTSISYWVKRHTRDAFGAPINLHLFRDCAATGVAIAAPENIDVVTAILGHTKITTSEKFYNQARSVEAGRRWHQTLAALSSRAGQRDRAQGRNRNGGLS